MENATLTGCHFVVKHVVGQGVIPPCQFAQFPHSSSADVVRVLHDTILSKWESTGEFWMVRDGIVPPYGSMGLKRVLHTLLAAGSYPPLASLMVNCAKQIRTYYGGPSTDCMPHTNFASGTGRGDPWSIHVLRGV